MKSLNLYLIVGAFALGALLSWHITRNHYKTEHRAYVAELNAESEKKLRESEARVAEIEKRLLTLRGDIESRYQGQINEQTARIAALERDNIRLRDPGRQSCGNAVSGDPGGSTDSEAGSPAEGLLSREATSFLLQFAGEADAVSAQLRACQEWVESVRASGVR